MLKNGPTYKNNGNRNNIQTNIDATVVHSCEESQSEHEIIQDVQGEKVNVRKDNTLQMQQVVQNVQEENDLQFNQEEETLEQTFYQEYAPKVRHLEEDKEEQWEMKNEHQEQCLAQQEDAEEGQVKDDVIEEEQSVHKHVELTGRRQPGRHTTRSHEPEIKQYEYGNGDANGQSNRNNEEQQGQQKNGDERKGNHYLDHEPMSIRSESAVQEQENEREDEQINLQTQERKYEHNEIQKENKKSQNCTDNHGGHHAVHPEQQGQCRHMESREQQNQENNVLSRGQEYNGQVNQNETQKRGDKKPERQPDEDLHRGEPIDDDKVHSKEKVLNDNEETEEEEEQKNEPGHAQELESNRMSLHGEGNIHAKRQGILAERENIHDEQQQQDYNQYNRHHHHQEHQLPLQFNELNEFSEGKRIKKNAQISDHSQSNEGRNRSDKEKEEHKEQVGNQTRTQRVGEGDELELVNEPGVDKNSDGEELDHEEIEQIVSVALKRRTEVSEQLLREVHQQEIRFDETSQQEEQRQQEVSLKNTQQDELREMYEENYAIRKEPEEQDNIRKVNEITTEKECKQGTHYQEQEDKSESVNKQYGQVNETVVHLDVNKHDDQQQKVGCEQDKGRDNNKQVQEERGLNQDEQQEQQEENDEHRNEISYLIEHQEIEQLQEDDEEYGNETQHKQLTQGNGPMQEPPKGVFPSVKRGDAQVFLGAAQQNQQQENNEQNSEDASSNNTKAMCRQTSCGGASGHRTIPSVIETLPLRNWSPNDWHTKLTEKTGICSRELLSKLLMSIRTSMYEDSFEKSKSSMNARRCRSLPANWRFSNEKIRWTAEDLAELIARVSAEVNSRPKVVLLLVDAAVGLVFSSDEIPPRYIAFALLNRSRIIGKRVSHIKLGDILSVEGIRSFLLVTHYIARREDTPIAFSTALLELLIEHPRGLAIIATHRPQLIEFIITKHFSSLDWDVDLVAKMFMEFCEALENNHTLLYECVDLLLSKAMNCTDCHNMRLCTRILVRMGLLKSEERMKCPSELKGELEALAHVFEQLFFPRTLSGVFVTFLAKPNPRLCNKERLNKALKAALLRDILPISAEEGANAVGKGLKRICDVCGHDEQYWDTATQCCDALFGYVADHLKCSSGELGESLLVYLGLLKSEEPLEPVRKMSYALKLILYAIQQDHIKQGMTREIMVVFLNKPCERLEPFAVEVADILNAVNANSLDN